MPGDTCPCGLRSAPCPNGQKPGLVLNCKIWRDHVQPSVWERIVGTIAAFLMGRW